MRGLKEAAVVLQMGKPRHIMACSHGRGSLSTMINSPCQKQPVLKDTRGGIQHRCHLLQVRQILVITQESANIASIPYKQQMVKQLAI